MLGSGGMALKAGRVKVVDQDVQVASQHGGQLSLCGSPLTAISIAEGTCWSTRNSLKYAIRERETERREREKEIERERERERKEKKKEVNLPSKLEDLNSKPSTTTKKKKWNRRKK
jgi:hypothetical protein